MKLAVDLNGERFRRGERVAGRVTVVESDDEARRLTMTISFVERTRDYVVPSSNEHVLHDGPLRAGQTVAFDFALPADARPSVKSEHAELYWEIDLKSDAPGLDAHLTRRLVVVV